jgi:hypothetical protein
MLVAMLNMDMAVVSSMWCISCPSQVYDTQKSEFKQTGDKIDMHEYTLFGMNSSWTTTVNGSTQKDQVCLGANGACVPDYEFFYVVSFGKEMFSDGILGLSPELSGQRLSFGTYLKKNKKIKDHIVALKVGPAYGNLTFGGYYKSLLAPDDRNINSTFSLRYSKRFRFKDIETLYFDAHDFTLGNKSLSNDPQATILHNTLDGIIIWTYNEL